MAQINDNFISDIHISLPNDNIPLVIELVKKLGGKIITKDDDYVSPPMPERERVGRMLKGLRLRANLTQKELAKQIDVPQSHISQYETNARPIPPAKAKELAKILNSVESHFLMR